MIIGNEFKKGDTAKIIKQRYIIAITIIAFLIISSHFVMEFTTKKSDFDSRIINIAGRQRMLSQKITKAVFGLYVSKNQIEKDMYIEEINTSLNIWEKSHYGLKNGDKNLGLPGNNSDLIKQSFKMIEIPFNIMVVNTKNIIHLATKNTLNTKEASLYLKTLRENELLFLPLMDKIVFQYDAEAKHKIAITKKISLTLGVLTLFILLLEALFIFKPLENTVSDMMDDLIEHEENLEKLFDAAPAKMFLISAENFQILRTNQTGADCIGLNFNEIITKKLTEYIDENYLKSLNVLDKNKFNGHINNVDIIFTNADGNSLHMLMSASRIVFHQKTIFFVGLTDISKQKIQETQLSYFATIDEMTGLINRRAGLLLLAKEFDNAKRYKHPLTLGFIDADGLKKVNDTYGHENGDFLIKSVAEILLKNIRTGDVALRYGGDEMVLLLLQCPIDLAYIIMNRINLDIDILNKTMNKPFNIAISYGLVELDDTIVNSDDMLIKADAAMYVKKMEKKQLISSNKPN